MGYEQIDLDFNSEKKESKPNTVPHSETWPKDGESDEDYRIRSFALTKKIINGEIILEKPTTDEINTEIELAKQLEKIKKNEIVKEKEPKKEVPDSSTQSKIDQMKSRKDLDY